MTAKDHLTEAAAHLEQAAATGDLPPGVVEELAAMTMRLQGYVEEIHEIDAEREAELRTDGGQSLPLVTEQAVPHPYERQAVRLLDAAGWTYDELAMVFECGRATIARICREGEPV